MKFTARKAFVGVIIVFPIIELLISFSLSNATSLLLNYILTIVVASLSAILLFSYYLQNFQSTKSATVLYVETILLNMSLAVSNFIQVISVKQPITIEQYPLRFIGSIVVLILFVIIFAGDILLAIKQKKVTIAINHTIPLIILFILYMWMIVSFIHSIFSHISSLNNIAFQVLIAIFISDIFALFISLAYSLLVFNREHYMTKALLLIGMIVSIFGDSFYGLNMLYELIIPIEIPYFFYLFQACLWLLASLYLMSEELPTIEFLDFSREKKLITELQEQAKRLFEELTLLSKFIRHDLSNDFAVVKSYIELFKSEGKELYLDRALTRLQHSENRLREHLITLTDIGTTEKYPLANIFDLLIYFPDVEVHGNKDVYVQGNKILNIVFYNIIDNAYKHGGAGVKVQIYIEDIADHVIITIVDNGKGIPTEFRDKLFQAPIAKAKKEGHGLALYLTKIYLERIGGSIRVEPNIPTGAKFIITLKKWED